MDTNIKAVSDRIKSCRIEKDYSLKKLESLTGISSSTLQRYENNICPIPVDKLQLIADALNTTTAYLMGWEGKELSFNSFHSLFPILEELGYKIEYEETEDMYFLVYNNERSFPITNEQIIDLKNTTVSYLKFKLHEIMYPQK
jgi:transcriptional regulator with XRE-family HTH domain